MRVRFKKVHPKAVTPTKAHASDAGFDLTAVSKKRDIDGNLIYGTGIAVEIPEGYVGLVFPRSSVSQTDLHMANSVGVIDSGYRGEIRCKFKQIASRFNAEGDRYEAENGKDIFDYAIGERIAQLIIIPYPEIEFEEAEELTETDRGGGGYGSTGR